MQREKITERQRKRRYDEDDYNETPSKIQKSKGNVHIKKKRKMHRDPKERCAKNLMDENTNQFEVPEVNDETGIKRYCFKLKVLM